MADTVHGSGPRPCSWAVVGTEPGFREMKRGEVFVGPTGEELFRLLALIGRNRKNTFLTNLFREPPPAKKVPHTEEQWAYGLACLKRELAEVRPRHIITLGAPIARLFLGDDVDLDECWGLHLKPSDEARELFALRPDCTLFPQVHPAAGFHSPEASSRVLVGFEDMQRKLEDGEPARGLYDDEYPNPLYRYATYVEDLGHWLEPNLPIALDTEGYNHAPWSVQASTSGGSAILIRNTQTDELGALKRRIAAAPSVIMHAGLHDLSVLRQLGIDLIEMGVPFDDTQLMAYLLNVEPQGLKPLMTRHCGMRVRSYQEVLGDAQDRHTRNYMAALWEKLHARHEQLRREDFHYQTVRLGRRIKKLPEHPKTNLHKAVERVMGSKTPSKLWAEQVEDYRVEAYKWMGDEVPEASLSDVPPDVALDYACKDPDGTGRVRSKLWPRIKSLGLEDVYRLDLSTYPIIDRMMRVGITPDVEAFAALGDTLDTEIAAVLRRIREATGESDFNPNSGDQVAEYLFDTLGVEPMGKRTTSGRESTNDKVLEALQHAYPEHEAIGDIRTYREYYKLRWSFIERLPRLIERWPHDGRIHCDLMMTRTPSGRLAAKAPNLLAMPKHGKFAKAFRRCFVPGAGRLFLSADESQVELRVGAHLSQDPVMLDIFAGRRRNPDGSLIDLHAAMVQRVTGKDPRDQSDADRLIGKCFHPDTEVLTRDGWKRISTLSRYEEVIQATPGSNGAVSLSWTRPIALTTRYAETLVHLKNEGIDLRVTPDHGMVGWTQGGQLKRFMPETLNLARYWANAGRLESTGAGPSPVMLQLAVAAQADGSIENGRLRFGFSKLRKIQRFRQLLQTAGIAVESKLYSNGQNPPTTTFRLDRQQSARILELLDSDKTFPWWWLELPEGAREIVLSEFPHWDGHQRPEWKATRYTSFKQKNLDVLQALAAITGRKTRQKGHDLTVRARATTRGGNLESTRVDYKGQVYCLSVPSGAVLVRDGGIPVITHQCINFGYWMGQTAIGLTLELRKSGLDVDEDDAQRWIDEANALYVGAVTYKERMVAEAVKNGYVRCLSGRIRYIGGIRSRDERVRAEAERFAYSTPVQEGAQFIGKMALKAAWDELFVPLRKQGRWVEPVLWIHDDLLSEADPETVMEMAPKLQAIMTRQPKGFTVPLATKPEAGMNWADMTTL